MTSKKHNNFLKSLVASSKQQEPSRDEEILEKVNFHNNEKSLEIKRGRFTYKSNNKNYNEFLINSKRDFHKVTVSSKSNFVVIQVKSDFIYTFHRFSILIKMFHRRKFSWNFSVLPMMSFLCQLH